MPWYEVVWNYEPGGNVEHIAEHGLTPDDVEAVIYNPWILQSAEVQAGLSSRVTRQTDV